MFEYKYWIIIGIFICICLLALYYFYDEISSNKKIIKTTYQKTMKLESKIMTLESQFQRKTSQCPIDKNKTNKSNDVKNNLRVKKPIDSPALSITYHSDVLRPTNSVKYTDINDAEVQEIRKNISQKNKSNKSNKPNKSKTPSPSNKPKSNNKS